MGRPIKLQLCTLWSVLCHKSLRWLHSVRMCSLFVHEISNENSSRITMESLLINIGCSTVSRERRGLNPELYYNWEVVRGPSVQRHDKIGNCRRYRYVHEINLQTQELIMLVLNLTNDAFLPISIFHVASGSWNLNPSLCGHGHPMLLELLKFSSIFQQSTRQIREAKVALHPIRQGK